MGNAGADRALRIVDSFESGAGTEAGFNVLRGGNPGAVLGEVGDRLVAVELAVATQGTGEEMEDVLALWKDGDSDDYANQTGFTD